MAHEDIVCSLKSDEYLKIIDDLRVAKIEARRARAEDWEVECAASQQAKHLMEAYEELLGDALECVVPLNVGYVHLIAWCDGSKITQIVSEGKHGTFLR